MPGRGIYRTYIMVTRIGLLIGHGYVLQFKTTQQSPTPSPYPAGGTPSRLSEDRCGGASSKVQSRHAPKGSTPRLTEGGTSTQKLPILFPLLPLARDSARLNLHTRWQSATHHAFKWTGSNVLRYPTVCKGNLGTLQPRNRTTFVLRLG